MSDIPKDIQFDQAWSAYGSGVILSHFIFGWFESYFVHMLIFLISLIVLFKVKYVEKGIAYAGKKYMNIAILLAVSAFIFSVIRTHSNLLFNIYSSGFLVFTGLCLFGAKAFGPDTVRKKFNIDQGDTEKWMDEQALKGLSKEVSNSKK